MEGTHGKRRNTSVQLIGITRSAVRNRSLRLGATLRLILAGLVIRLYPSTEIFFGNAHHSAQRVLEVLEFLLWRSGWVEVRLHKPNHTPHFMSADPFASSRSKLTWAKENLLPDLNRRIDEFHDIEPYAKVIEPDPQAPGWEIHKIKLVRPLPEAVINLVGDLVGNLRESLDTAGYAIAIAAKSPKTKSTAFPFASDLSQMNSSIGRSADLPKEIQSLFCGFQPYRGGDDLLWALNELCNGKKHKIVTPMQHIFWRTRASVRGHGRPFSMPNPHRWDSANDEMVVVRLGPVVTSDATWDYDFDFEPFIAINEVPVVEGHPVAAVMYELCLKVESVLTAIEAEARRLGYIS